jgi:hypothetical protein
MKPQSLGSGCSCPVSPGDTTSRNPGALAGRGGTNCSTSSQKLIVEAAAILEADLSGHSEIELLGAFGWDAENDIRALRRMQNAAAMAANYLAITAGPIIDTDVQQKTWLFLELRELYMALSGRTKIGRGGPLYRFITKAVTLVFEDIEVPNQDNMYGVLLAAVKRRKKLGL